MRLFFGSIKLGQDLSVRDRLELGRSVTINTFANVGNTLSVFGDENVEGILSVYGAVALVSDISVTYSGNVGVSVSVLAENLWRKSS